MHQSKSLRMFVHFVVDLLKFEVFGDQVLICSFLSHEKDATIIFEIGQREDLRKMSFISGSCRLDLVIRVIRSAPHVQQSSSGDTICSQQAPSRDESRDRRSRSRDPPAGACREHLLLTKCSAMIIGVTLACTLCADLWPCSFSSTVAGKRMLGWWIWDILQIIQNLVHRYFWSRWTQLTWSRN